MSGISNLLGGDGNFGKDQNFHQAGNFVQGIVDQNSDKKFPGMVKVQFTAWTDGKSISDWMPVMQSLAGAKHGSYIMPEVGDIVIVGFMGAGMKRPFVMGSLFPANSEMAKQSFQDKNSTKRLVDKGGNEITIVDAKDKGAVTITTAKGLTIKIEDEKEIITLSDKNGENIVKMDCKGGKIDVTAKKTITLKAGKSEISLADNGAVNINGETLSIKGNKKVELSSSQMLNISGNMLKAEGKQTATIKGGTMAEISGGMVKIN